MDLTTEEKESLRELLAQIRQVAEDFMHEYLGRLAQQLPKNRLMFLAMRDSAETVLGVFADTLALLDDPEKYQAVVSAREESKEQYESLAQQYVVWVDCFHWAAERCLGEAFTPLARSSQRKLTMISSMAVIAGVLGTLNMIPDDDLRRIRTRTSAPDQVSEYQTP